MTVNYLAVLVAAIVMMIVGWLWYGAIFRKPWSKAMGMDNMDPAAMEAMKKTMGMAYFQQFIAALISAWVLAMFIIMYGGYKHTSGVHAGLMAGFWIWLGFYLPFRWGSNLWGKKSWTAFWIDLFYYLVNFLIAGAILGIWK